MGLQVQKQGSSNNVFGSESQRSDVNYERIDQYSQSV